MRVKKTARHSRHFAQAMVQDGPVVAIPDLDDKEAQRLKEIEEGNMQASLKYIDKKFTEQGQTYYAETVEQEIPDQINWWTKYALCLVRHMDRSNTVVQKISLQINSQHLKDLLKETIGEFPGVSFQTKQITIDAPYRVLFHYRHELEQAAQLLKDEEAIAHLELLLEFIEEQFEEIIEECDNLLPQGLISFKTLWTIFRPGCTIFAPVFGQERAFTLDSYSFGCNPPCLDLQGTFVDFDGADFGLRNTVRSIHAFAGTDKIADLSAMPIDFHPAADVVKKTLIERGRRFEALAGMQFRYYSGVALESTAGGYSRYNCEGRVVVDTKTFHRLNSNAAFSVAAFKSDEEKRSKRRRIGNEDDEMAETMDLVPQDELELDPLTDEQCLLASSMVRGFSFSEKRWFDFFVDRCSPVDWNPRCFDQLVLPETQKDLVQALVANHVQQRHGFDDIVKGKGKGLILVLHGPPGVGKTLTAETVAEYCKRPLYMVSSGDLGTNSETLDERLSRILDMASTWKAVLLIDEADVFLERRSLHDMERNSLVSIFLRVLEYYEGILFLTSNRVGTFDDAFKSRIHVPLRYNDLTAASRKAIWKNFLEADGALGTTQMDGAGYESLAQAEINGRQIKNVIRTAKSLAQFHGEKLNRAKLEQVIKIQMEFEEQLTGESGTVNGNAVHGH